MNLQELEHKAAICTCCGLYVDRIKPVFSRGSKASRVMICGMCPGADENIAGIPFVGKAGKILDIVIEKAYGESIDPYITNIVKCFVPPGISLETNWMESCLPYFIVQLGLIRPRVIIGLGGDVCKFLLDTDQKIGELKGKVISYLGNTKFIPTYHPSYLARGGGVNHRQFDMVVNHFKLAHKFV